MKLKFFNFLIFVTNFNFNSSIFFFRNEIFLYRSNFSFTCVSSCLNGYKNVLYFFNELLADKLVLLEECVLREGFEDN